MYGQERRSDMVYIIMIVIGFGIAYLFSSTKNETSKLKEEPFGKKFKVLVDRLGSNLWDGEKFILIKKSARQYFIQKSKLPNNEGHVFIVCRPNTINLDFYEKVAGVTVKYSKMYNISDSSINNQNRIANDFATEVRLLGKMEY